MVAFAAGTFLGLIFGIIQVVFRGKQALPFGPSLAIGVMITLLFWQAIAPRAWLLFSDPFYLGFFGVVGPVLFVVVAFLFRLVRGSAPPEESDEAGKGL